MTRHLDMKGIAPALFWLMGVCLTAGPLTGCRKAPARTLTAEEFQEEAEKAYLDALEAFHNHDWTAVPILMEDVKREFAGTRWARLAQLRIADALFRQGSYAEAITAYREFLRDFPSDPEVPYARYRVVLCQFESSGESVIAPPLEERDLVNVQDLSRSVDSFIRDYPDYPEIERALYMRKWARGMLARHELYVARYYLSRDNLEAAVARVEYALVTYKETGLEAEALLLLGEIHLRARDLDEAETAFHLVLDRFPDSPFVKPAENFLAELRRQRNSDKPGPSPRSAP